MEPIHRIAYSKQLGKLTVHFIGNLYTIHMPLNERSCLKIGAAYSIVFFFLSSSLSQCKKKNPLKKFTQRVLVAANLFLSIRLLLLLLHIFLSISLFSLLPMCNSTQSRNKIYLYELTIGISSPI